MAPWWDTVWSGVRSWTTEMFPLRYLLLSALVRGCTACTYSACVFGVAGQNITLPCSYDSRYYDLTPTCWGREPVPSSKCSGTILSTEGEGVTSRTSPRYVLLSGVGDGNVSLTILHALESDTGVYGCRVEIPGWFNDLKQNIHLTVVSANQDPITMPTVQPLNERQEFISTLGVKSDSSIDPQVPGWERQKLVMILVKVGAIFFITLAVIFAFILGRWKQHTQEKTPVQEDTIYENIQIPDR